MMLTCFVFVLQRSLSLDPSSFSLSFSLSFDAAVAAGDEDDKWLRPAQLTPATEEIRADLGCPQASLAVAMVVDKTSVHPLMPPCATAMAATPLRSTPHSRLTSRRLNPHHSGWEVQCHHRMHRLRAHHHRISKHDELVFVSMSAFKRDASMPAAPGGTRPPDSLLSFSLVFMDGHYNSVIRQSTCL